MPADAFKLIVGEVSRNGASSVGFADLSSLGILLQVSRSINRAVLRVWDVVNQWGTNFIPRILSDADKGILQLFSCNPSAERFHLMGSFLADNRFAYDTTAVREQIEDLENNEILSHHQCYILKCGLRDAQPADLISAAEYLEEHGNIDGAVKLLRRAAAHDLAASELINEIHILLVKMGMHHLALDIDYLRFSNPNATRDDFSSTMIRIKKDPNHTAEYKEKKLAMLRKIAAHPNADYLNIVEAASGLKCLGNTDLAVSVLLKASSRTDIKPGDIYACACVLGGLGKKEEALQLYRKWTEMVGLDDILREIVTPYISRDVKAIFTEEAAIRCHQLVDHPNATPDDIFKAAEAFKVMKKYDEALVLYQRVLAHPDLKLWETRVLLSEAEEAIIEVEVAMEFAGRAAAADE